MQASFAGITPLSLAAGFRPARTYFFAGRSLQKPDSVLGAVLQFRRTLSCPTTEGNIRASPKITQEIQQLSQELSTKSRKLLMHRMLSGA
jgi:hypothetical protein